MQKTFVKIISRKVLTAALLTGTAAMEAAPESKELNNNMTTVSTNIESGIEFTGANENTIFFDVKVENPDGNTFTLEIQDDEANILFSKNYSHTNLVEEVRLPNEKLIAHYYFTINHNKEAEQSFVVSITNKIADDAEAA
jgi:hypothetical protein